MNVHATILNRQRPRYTRNHKCRPFYVNKTVNDAVGVHNDRYRSQFRCDIKIVATTGLAKNWKVSGVFPIVEYLR